VWDGFDDISLAPHFSDWTFASPTNAVGPHPSLRATLSHKERENNKRGCAQTDVACHGVATASGNVCL